ncbi:MAG TPA: hypothetical protein VGU22_14580 [Methylomirabilota bacterium]|jgi:hypothetical protein|nr:hypothetical protein [Methylomirabilota bacterium]
MNEARRLIEEIVTNVAPNATVIGVEEQHEGYRVSVTGTSGVVANCELPRDAVESAGRWREARARLAATLKRCADDVDAPIPDGRA